MLIPLFLSGCLDLAASVANAPTYFGNLERKADVAYGPEPRQKLDIYAAKSGAPDKLKPVVVFFYGGRWSFGEKEQYRFVAARLAKAGYVVVIPDYIKYPDAKFPAFMDDAARSVVWVNEHIGAYGGDTSRLFLLGHSSGAHMGALLISDRHYLAKYGSSPRIVTAFAGLAGPYDFTPDEPDLKAIFGPPSQYPLMQVPTFITGNEPPMLLLYGSDDSSVAYYNLARLADSIRGHHGKVETKVYPDVGHVGIIGSFARDPDPAKPVPQDCIDFFNRFNH